MTLIQYDIAIQASDLQAILALQQKNLANAISPKEAQQEGFVTVKHEFTLLERMNQPYPHIVARANGQLIAYALLMLQELKNDIPVLIPMFQEIDTIIYKGIALKYSAYVVMGQICIDKTFRGQGIFNGLYQKMKFDMRPHFDYIITEISARNSRSIKAHKKVGFQTIKKYTADKQDWIIVLLETKEPF